MSEIKENVSPQWAVSGAPARPTFVMPPKQEVTQMKKKDDPPEQQDIQPSEFVVDRTTLNFAMDSEINQMVLKIKDERGDVIMQIPEEARLRIARHIRKTYEQPRRAIFDADA